MNKLRYGYTIAVQKLSNIVETAAIPLLYESKQDLIVDKDIKYSDSKNSVCDYYYLPDKQTKKPLFIYIHGGGFICGTKRLRKYYCYRYAKSGYFVMNTHYDYAPKKQFPFQIHQLYNAIENILDKAEEYNIDTERIVLAGESAGAYFCSYIAAISKNKQLYNEMNICFKYRDTFDVKACVLLNGAVDVERMATSTFLNMGLFLNAFFNMPRKALLKEENKEKLKYFSPMNFIDEKFPPSMVVMGAHDELAQDSYNLIEVFKKFNIKHDQFLAKGLIGIHGFSLACKTKEGGQCLEKTMTFLKEHV